MDLINSFQGFRNGHAILYAIFLVQIITEFIKSVQCIILTLNLFPLRYRSQLLSKFGCLFTELIIYRSVEIRGEFYGILYHIYFIPFSFLFRYFLIDVSKLATDILFFLQQGIKSVICMLLFICSGTDVISRRIYRRFSRGNFISGIKQSLP
ncbi:hypothetical protein BvCmsKSP027_03634 [Escherichia coli]|nr:hypothetical protein BvCmsKSP027_03634 [Escherichia coli]